MRSLLIIKVSMDGLTVKLVGKATVYPLQLTVGGVVYDRQDLDASVGELYYWRMNRCTAR